MPNDVAVTTGRMLSETQNAFVIANMPIGLQIFLDPKLNDQCKALAHYMSRAEGMTPKHLIGKPEACFGVLSRAITWNLDPYGVAQTTYQTPGGQVSYYGSLCQAILESSNRLVGGIKFEMYGDWGKLRGKFEIRTNDKGNKYPVATHKPEDEIGLGVRVSAQLKGEAEPRTMDFDLRQAFPRNSTLWATDPQTQIKYTAVRRFATSAVPTLFLGAPFDNEGIQEWADTLKDVTPGRPTMEEAGAGSAASARGRGRPRKEEPAKPPEPVYFFADTDGVVHEFAEGDADRAIQTFDALLTAAASVTHAEAIWENGAQFITALRETGHDADADMLNQTYADICDRLAQAEGTRERQAAGGGEGGEGDEPGQEQEQQDDHREPEPGQEQQQEERREPNPPAAVHAEKAPAATSTAASPGPSATGEPGDDKLLVPLGDSVQAWFGPARARVKDMLDQNAPPAAFKRFRVVNADAMKRLEREFRSWFSILDKILAGAETGP